MGNTICSVTVTYNPDRIINEQIDVLKRTVDFIIIVDNASVKKDVFKYIKRNKNLLIINNNNNTGLAAALNTGIEIAIKRRHKWIITFDQDSLPDDKMIENMLKVYNKIKYEGRENIAAIFPYHIEEKNKDRLKNFVNLYQYVETGITSGSMFKTEIFKKTGEFEEKLFIDYIDYEWCLRAGKKGYKFIQVNNAILFHKLGDTKEVYFLNKKRSFTNHPALRRYYITRNRFYVYKKYFTVAKNFVINDFKSFLKEIIKIILFEENKVKKIYMIFLGLIHFLFNKYGKLR